MMQSLTPRETLSAVGTSSVEISPELGESGQRDVIVITNTSTAGQTITLSFGKDAIANRGIVLYPTGAWSESIDSAFIPTNSRICAISSAASGQVTIHERVKMRR